MHSPFEVEGSSYARPLRRTVAVEGTRSSTTEWFCRDPGRGFCKGAVFTIPFFRFSQGGYFAPRAPSYPGHVLVGRAVKDLVQSRWVLGHRVFPRDPAPGVLEHCRGPVWPAGVPLGALDMSWQMSFWGFGAYEIICFPQKEIDAPSEEGTQPGESGESR
jgi:hypothetical protein